MHRVSVPSRDYSLFSPEGYTPTPSLRGGSTSPSSPLPDRVMPDRPMVWGQASGLRGPSRRNDGFPAGGGCDQDQVSDTSIDSTVGRPLSPDAPALESAQRRFNVVLQDAFNLLTSGPSTAGGSILDLETLG